jgi:hypothetical protein
VQRGERHLQLGLDAGDLHDPAARRLPSGVSQQRGFADPCFTADDQDPSDAGTHRVQGVVENLALLGTSSERGYAPGRHAINIGPGPDQGNALV